MSVNTRPKWENIRNKPTLQEKFNLTNVDGDINKFRVLDNVGGTGFASFEFWSEYVSEGFGLLQVNANAEEGFGVGHGGSILSVNESVAAFTGGSGHTVGVNPTGYQVSHPSAFRSTIGAIANADLQAALADYLLRSGGTLTGALNFGGFTATNLGSPSAGTDATNKNYVDNAINGLNWKTACRVATTANITLSGTQTIDGVSVTAGDRVLVKNQTTTSANGIYVVAAGSWSRSTDSDTAAEIDGSAVYVRLGTTQADTAWTETATVTTVGTDAIAYAQIGSGASYTAGSGLTLTGNTFALSSTPALGTPTSGNLANCTFPTLNQNTTGSAATLTTARTINGVSFNGSANITVADATKLPLTGGALTGVLSVSNSTIIAMSVAGSGTSARISVNSTNNNTGVLLQESGTNRWSIASYSGGRFTFFNETANGEALGITASGSRLLVNGITDDTTTQFQVSGGGRFTGNLVTAALIGLGVYTVATLPSASANASRIATVTDSSVTTNGTAVSGGGANRVMVFSNGTTWDVVVA